MPRPVQVALLWYSGGVDTGAKNVLTKCLVRSPDLGHRHMEQPKATHRYVTIWAE